MVIDYVGILTSLLWIGIGLFLIYITLTYMADNEGGWANLSWRWIVLGALISVYALIPYILSNWKKVTRTGSKLTPIAILSVLILWIMFLINTYLSEAAQGYLLGMVIIYGPLIYFGYRGDTKRRFRVTVLVGILIGGQIGMHITGI